MIKTYKCLSQAVFVSGNYKIVPIRDEDKYAIMQWRNDQLDVLRQEKPLTKEQQEEYFNKVVNKLFEVEKPSQLLFSFIEGESLIGYGGLVHIDWISKNAEISFLTPKERASNPQQFVEDWKQYLKILKEIAGTQLSFNKIYTYAYDIRPPLFKALLESDFIEEARLRKHILIKGDLVDVRIHSFFLEDLLFRMANPTDVDLYFKWANDEQVRANSYNRDRIEYDAHVKWFLSKLASEKCHLYLFSSGRNIAVGQVRIECAEETTIGISVDGQFRGRSMSAKMIKKATDDFLAKNPTEHILAYIKYDNTASYKSFISAGFKEDSVIEYHRIRSYRLKRML